jgi:hypothetical protein
VKVTITIELNSAEELIEWAARLLPSSNGHAELLTTGPLEDLVRAEHLEQTDTRSWKPAADVLEADEPDLLTKICRKCHNEFTTTSRVRIVCDGCLFEADALRESPIKRARAGRPAGEIRHGTRYAYNKRGCRCDECKAAEREYKQQKKAALA